MEAGNVDTSLPKHLLKENKDMRQKLERDIWPNEVLVVCWSVFKEVGISQVERRRNDLEEEEQEYLCCL